MVPIFHEKDKDPMTWSFLLFDWIVGKVSGNAEHSIIDVSPPNSLLLGLQTPQISLHDLIPCMVLRQRSADRSIEICLSRMIDKPPCLQTRFGSSCSVVMVNMHVKHSY